MAASQRVENKNSVKAEWGSRNFYETSPPPLDKFGFHATITVKKTIHYLCTMCKIGLSSIDGQRRFGRFDFKLTEGRDYISL